MKRKLITFLGFALIAVIALGALWMLPSWLSERTATAYENALLALEGGYLAEAQEILQKALKRNPQSHPLKVLLGWSYYQLGQTEAAQQTFSALLVEDPHFIEAQKGYVASLLSLGQIEKALPLLVELQKQEPNDEWVRETYEIAKNSAPLLLLE